MTLPTLNVFDTMSGRRRPLEPLRDGHIGLYVCGVTVYDLIHIGHARVYVTFDVITRYMRHRGYDVTYVRNFTDVDDKIIHRANENGEDALALSARFIDEFHRDLGRLGCRDVQVEPKVSTHMAEIIAMVEQLIARDMAYAVDGDVFFSVERFGDYGKLSGWKVEESRAGERVDVDSRKRHPADFALWKSAKPGEPTWESPWGPGRPGWHIECSAMSTCHLGDSFDIHGGGKDLVFPHHENEIAQSEGATGKPYVGTWMHIGLVNIDGEKMSKSLGNFWTIRDVLEIYHPETVRWFLVSAHYRKPINYGPANLDLARHRLQYLYRTREEIGGFFSRVDRPDVVDQATLDELLGALHAGMDDDFNCPVALAVLGDAAKRANELLTTKKAAKKPEVIEKLAAIDAFFDVIAETFGVLGGDPSTVLLEIRGRMAAQLGIDGDAVEAKIAARKAARDAKDWAEADRIRDELAEQHVELMDGADGTRWAIVPPEPEVEATDAADA